MTRSRPECFLIVIQLNVLYAYWIGYCRFDKPGAKTFSNNQQSKPADPPIESLHPSWQASKRKKEQLELIKSGPSNKKIKFDDD